jgi:hypothetical protein
MPPNPSLHPKTSSLLATARSPALCSGSSRSSALPASRVRRPHEVSTMLPNPSLHPKCYSGLRPLAHSGELKR